MTSRASAVVVVRASSSRANEKKKRRGEERNEKKISIHARARLARSIPRRASRRDASSACVIPGDAVGKISYSCVYTV